METNPTPEEKEVLRHLADEIQSIAILPIQKERKAQWTALNNKNPIKPMIYITEIPWVEMDYEDELILQCSDPFLRQIEQNMRRELYQWKHMQADMVIQETLYFPKVIHDTGFGISEDVEIQKTDERSDVISRHYHAQIKTEADIQKIKDPIITYDVEATQARLHCLQEIVGAIMPVKAIGARGFWFAPWDWLIAWYGVTEAMMDLALKPALVHAAIDRTVQAFLMKLNQYEEMGLLESNNGPYRVGSGGYGYTDALPEQDLEDHRYMPSELWGGATAQIFSDVSPTMHQEFALAYELKWLNRFGVSYYGCCEPLHNKLDILKTIPNLRKISMSPWANLDQAVPKMADNYIISHKPNPNIFTRNEWNPDLARKNLRSALEKTQGCAIEIVLKDISTVNYRPQQLWDWAKIAKEETDRI